MAPRYKKQCWNCPEADRLRRAGFLFTPAGAPPSAPLTPQLDGGTLAITSDSEGHRLWKHVLFGAGTCIGMIEGYHGLGMPGNPKEDLIVLRDRLHTLISKIEATPNEDPIPEERPAPDDSDHGSDIELEHVDDAG